MEALINEDFCSLARKASSVRSADRPEGLVLVGESSSLTSIESNAVYGHT